MDRLTELYRLRARVDAEIEAERRALARRERAAAQTQRPPLPDVSKVPAWVIREWARLNDIAVPDRGRLPHEVRDAYARACRTDPARLFAHA